MFTLIAEYDALSRISLHRMLSNWVHDVLIAEDGLLAWEVMRRDDPPMLVILDWMTPGDGRPGGLSPGPCVAPGNPPYIILSGK